MYVTTLVPSTETTLFTAAQATDTCDPHGTGSADSETKSRKRPWKQPSKQAVHSVTAAPRPFTRLNEGLLRRQNPPSFLFFPPCALSHTHPLSIVSVGRGRLDLKEGTTRGHDHCPDLQEPVLTSTTPAPPHWHITSLLQAALGRYTFLCSGEVNAGRLARPRAPQVYRFKSLWKLGGRRACSSAAPGADPGTISPSEMRG